MKKGKYIDYYVLLACLSKKPESQQPVDELLSKAMNEEVPAYSEEVTENSVVEMQTWGDEVY